MAEQTTLTTDNLPQLSVKATKAKASGVQTTELSLFSTYPLLSAYYLTIYIYSRMCLTTGVYNM